MSKEPTIHRFSEDETLPCGHSITELAYRCYLCEERRRVAAQRLLDFLYVWGLPDTESSREELAKYLNALQEAIGPRDKP